MPIANFDGCDRNVPKSYFRRFGDGDRNRMYESHRAKHDSSKVSIADANREMAAPLKGRGSGAPKSQGDVFGASGEDFRIPQ